jgi:hypothetical protein
MERYRLMIHSTNDVTVVEHLVVMFLPVPEKQADQP